MEDLAVENNSEQTTSFEDMLSEDLKKILAEVKSELCTLNSDLKELDALTELDKVIVEKFFEKNDITILPQFKEQLTTPFAITKYLSLTVQQNALVNQIETALQSLLSTEKVTWLIHKDFSNTITFTKVLPVNSEEKPQSLLVKYRLDPENDEKIIYTIAAGNWGWDIDELQLKGLLENTQIELTQKFIKKDTIYSTTDKDIIIKANGMEIIVKKL